MKSPKILSLFLISSLAALPAGADSWKVLGPRAMGMGGAFVAVAEGPVAQYWNPAGLAKAEGMSGLNVPAGAQAAFNGTVLKNANHLGAIASDFQKIQAAQTNGTSNKFDAQALGSFFEGLKNISDMNQPGNGVDLQLAGGVGLRLKRVALSLNNYTSMGLTPFVDVTNIGLGAAAGVSGVSFSGGTGAPSDPEQAAAAGSISGALGAPGFASLDALTGGALSAAGVDATTVGNALVNYAAANGQTNAQITAAAGQVAVNAGAVLPLLGTGSAGNSYANNRTHLTVRGGSFTEAALGLAFPMPVKGLYIGGNLKATQGEVGYSRFDVMNKEAGTTQAFSNFRDNVKKSIQPALDLGLMWRLDESFKKAPLHPVLGLTARNINSPKFDQPAAAIADGEPATFTLDRQVRAGMAVSPFRWWHVAFDYDLTENKTSIPGLMSRTWGLGTEINIFNRAWINVPLRAGLSKNTADKNGKPTYTAGVGLNFLHLIFDVAGSVSSETTAVDSGGTSKKVPSNAGVAAQFSFLF